MLFFFPPLIGVASSVHLSLEQTAEASPEAFRAFSEVSSPASGDLIKAETSMRRRRRRHFQSAQRNCLARTRPEGVFGQYTGR